MQLRADDRLARQVEIARVRDDRAAHDIVGEDPKSGRGLLAALVLCLLLGGGPVLLWLAQDWEAGTRWLGVAAWVGLLAPALSYVYVALIEPARLAGRATHEWASAPVQPAKPEPAVVSEPDGPPVLLPPDLDARLLASARLGRIDDAIAANYLIINVPKDETGNDAETQVPGLFGEVELAAIVDANGKVLAVSADEAIALNEALHGHLSPQAATVFEAALRGESDLTQLATRGDGSLTAAVPILGHDNQVVGAMLFTTHAFPISESEFLQKVLQQMILPFAGIMLVVGVVVGALFGFLIARGLTRRLRNLSEAADAWSEGNFQVLAQDNAGDELSRLAGHLNHMAIQLQNLLQTRQELAGLEERNRLARELHDSVKQQVFATAMQVGAAKALIDRQPDQVKPHLQEAEQLVREAQQELTTLILELRPAALEGQGLAKALNHYVADWSRQTKVKADIRISGERLLPLPTEQTLFRVAQEALANIARHSRATAAEIYLGWEADEIRLVISDNGCGFNMSQVNGKGVGLQSMRERIEVLGGHFFVKSQPGVGTQVIARIVNPEKRST